MLDYLTLASKATTPKELGRLIGSKSKGNDSNDLAWRLSDWRDSDFDLWYDRLERGVCFTVGDYDNDLVHVANLQSIRELFADELSKGRYIWECHSIAYCTTFIVMPKLFHKLCTEVLEPLDNYPLLDEDLHSNLQYADFEETINDESDSYWRREIEEEHIDQDRFRAGVWAELRKEQYENTVYPGDISYTDLETAIKSVHRRMRKMRKSRARKSGSITRIAMRAAQSWLW